MKYKKLGVVQGTGFYQDEDGDVWASNSDLSLERDEEEDISHWNKSCIFFITDDPLEFCRDLKELLLNAVQSCK